jgi:hypothetical protein
MSAKSGFWSALGALVGGTAGAAAGYYAAQARPSFRYAGAHRGRGQELEDAMVVGGSAGAVVGAFIGGAVSADDAPQLPR